jgi:hypothetical protein
MNINANIRIKISSGAAFLIGLAVALLFAVLSKWVKPMADNFLAGLTAILGLVGSYLLQQHGSNKLDVETAKAGEGAVTALNEIKVAAAAPKTPCPPETK